jgi:Phytanoyl-CoA dioxygenase (PhyH)
MGHKADNLRAMTADTDLRSLTLGDDGAQWFEGAVKRDVAQLRAAFEKLPQDQAGIRLHGIESLRIHLAPTGPIGRIAAQLIGPHSRAVRAILFDKTRQTNWSLAWHQDRAICVKHKIDVPGFGPWTVKSGMLHVAPPTDILSRMITLRVHLDDVPITNAPLLIALGSHSKGRVPETEIGEIVSQATIVACLAKSGDIWAYATPILHASDAATAPARRRVLQIDYAAEDLPGGLEWLGV